MMEEGEEYLEKLRAVFDLFDPEKLGYITTDHFTRLAGEHFGFGAEESQSQEINDLVRVLDEEGDGKIYFQEFCRGVQQILTLNSARGAELPTEGLAKSPSRDIGSEETLVAEDDANSCGNTSEVSTFNEYDMMTDDDGGATVQPDISSSPPTGLLINFDDDVDAALSPQLLNGQEYRGDFDRATDEEETFECYGDTEENESDTESKPSSHNNLLLSPISGGELRRPPRHRERRDWLKQRRASIAIGGGRRVTSSALASQLYRSSPVNVSGSRRSSGCSDNILEDIDGSFTQLNDKVKQLESQIVLLNDTQSKNDDRHLRLREENTFLVERVHILEEQLRDVEIKAQSKIQEEERKNREFMSRTDKDKTAEIEILSQSLQHIEREYQVLQEEAPKLRTEVERLKRENVNFEEKLNETQFNLHSLSDEHQETLEKLQQQRDEMVQERVVHAQLLDELGKELQELRNYKVESEERSRLHAPSPKDIPSLHKRELENHIVRLKEENVRLKEQNDDLQAQVLGMQVREGRNLLATGSTLADELQTLPRDEDSTSELLQKLQEQRDENAKLREYVDSIILRIMEKNPDLLEVDSPTPEKKNKRGLLSMLKKS